MAGDGIRFNVRHDLARLEADLGLYEKETMAAAVRALNRTMTTVRKDAVSRLKPEYPGVKVATLKGRLRFGRASVAKPRAYIEFSGRRFPLYGNFGMRPDTSGRQPGAQFGVRFGKLPWRIETIGGDPVSPAMLARAFRQRVRSSGRGTVFSRESAARLSFQVLVAPGLARAFTERAIGQALLIVGRARFAVVLEQEAKYRLSKRSA